MKKMMSAAMTAVMMCTSLLAQADDSVFDMGIAASAANTELAEPKGLKADIGTDSVVFRWNKVKGADKYYIYRYDSSNFDYVKIGAVSSNKCTLKKLSAGVNYRFTVTAVKNGSESIRLQSIEVMTKIKAKSWISAYRKILKVWSEEYTYDAMCSLYDVTGDGVPELILSTGTSHPCGVYIYTYSGGTASPVVRSDRNWYALGSGGAVAYFPSTGLIDSYYCGMGAMTNQLFRIKNGKAEMVLFSENGEYVVPDQGTDCYRINEKDVTKSEYDKAVKPYDKDFVFLGRSYIIDPDKIDKRYKNQGYECIDDVFDKVINEGFSDFSTSYYDDGWTDSMFYWNEDF